MNADLFASIKEAVENNPHINARDLITFVYNKNEQYANELTRISCMYDLKDEPIKQADFLQKSIVIDQLEKKINNAKLACRNAGSASGDEFATDIFEMQKELARLKNERNRL